MSQTPSDVQRTASNDRKIAWGMIASLAGRVVAVLGGLILLPCLYRNLTGEELGIWFLIAQPAVLLGLLDFGLTPTLTRKIALVSAGSGEASSESNRTDSTSPTFDSDSDSPYGHRLADVLSMAKRLFAINATLVFVICLAFGQWMAETIDCNETYRPTLRLVFLLSAITYAVQAYAGRYISTLAGRGHVGPAAAAGTVTRLLGIFFKVAAVFCGGRLLTIVATDITVAVLTIAVAKIALDRLEPSAVWMRCGKWCKQTAAELRPLAIRSWLTAVGAFLILRTDQYFIVFGLGTTSLPDYQSTLFVFSQIHQIAMIAAVSSSVFISQMWAIGDFREIHRLLRRNADLAMMVMIGGAAFMLLCGEPIIQLWLGENHFVGIAIMSVFATMLILETHHVVFAMATIATGDEGFAMPAILAGILNLAMTAVLVRTHGLIGVAFATLIAQALTNNWYAVYRAHRRLNLDFWVHIKECLIPYAAIACCMIVPPLALRSFGLYDMPWVNVFLFAGWIGIVIAAFLIRRHGTFLLRRTRWNRTEVNPAHAIAQDAAA